MGLGAYTRVLKWKGVSHGQFTGASGHTYHSHAHIRDHLESLFLACRMQPGNPFHADSNSHILIYADFSAVPHPVLCFGHLQNLGAWCRVRAEHPIWIPSCAVRYGLDKSSSWFFITTVCPLSTPPRHALINHQHCAVVGAACCVKGKVTLRDPHPKAVLSPWIISEIANTHDLSI